MASGIQEKMHIKFWGACGSLPAPADAGAVRRKVCLALEAAQGRSFRDMAEIERFVDGLPFAVRGTYGGNTACVQISRGEDSILCDAGTGLRDFGNSLRSMKKGQAPIAFHIFLSHLHWDHIQGLPFFTPIYVPGNTVCLYGCHPDMKEAIADQHASCHFPVPFSALGAGVSFRTLSPGEEYEINGFKVRAVEQNHPGRSYGYSFEAEGKKVVYSTDSEHHSGEEADAAASGGFFSGADLLIFDAQYSLADADVTKRDWGHSSNLIGVEFAVQAGVKRLVLFHREPALADEELDNVLENTRKYARIHAGNEVLAVDMAYDGLELEV